MLSHEKQLKTHSFIFAFSFCFFLSSFAQKNSRTPDSAYPIDGKSCLTSFQTVYLGKENMEERLNSFLASKIPALQEKNASLRLQHKIESPGGIHFTFEQLYKGFRIFRSQVKVTMDRSGNITSVFDHSFEVSETTDDFSTLEKVFLSLPMDELADHYKKELVYFPGEKNMIPALRLEISQKDDYYEILYDGNGQVIYDHDLAAYSSPPDSIVSAAIFLPDPLTTASAIYGVPYSDNNNSDVTELNAERKIVSVKVKYDTSASLFRLESPFVKITEHSSPSILPVTSPVPDFSFTRAQSGFEDINVFYHISNFHEYMQGLGFGNLVNYAISVDAHALNGQDNSNFIAFPNPRLNFGEGGVDDAEDADVIIHEYGHAISNSAAPNTNFGTERSALDEALGDYLASSYSRSINPFNWENVFSWDGHNEFWNGRLSISTDHYPEDMQNDLYGDADIWSSTMMEIWEDIGRENADALQFQALYGYSSGMSMSDAARLVIQADSALNNGAFYPQLCARFYNRGLVNGCETGIHKIADDETGIQLLNAERFASGNDAILRFKKPVNAEIRMFDINGKLVFRQMKGHAAEIYISGKNLAAGMYFLHVASEKPARNFKLVKL